MVAPTTQSQQPASGHQEQPGSAAPAPQTETVNAANIASKRPQVAALLRRIHNL